jgi:hypothetical protein
MVPLGDCLTKDQTMAIRITAIVPAPDDLLGQQAVLGQMSTELQALRAAVEGLKGTIEVTPYKPTGPRAPTSPRAKAGA